MDMLKSVHIEGFKSIRDATIDLGPLTVLIGANGSGKSNFVSFLRMVQAIAEGRLREFVGRAGGASALLHYGYDVTRTIAGEVAINAGSQQIPYRFHLSDFGTEGLFFSDEECRGIGAAFVGMSSHVPPALQESTLLSPRSRSGDCGAVAQSIEHWQTFHVHNTALAAPIRQPHYIEDNQRLHHDASNLAAHLYMLRETRRAYYDRIISAFRMAAPFFDDFVVEPRELDPTQVMLNWRERGRDLLFGPHQLSDGSLRTIALLTLLLQPEDRLPSLMIIDEPELGLHPYVITMVADLLRAVSTQCQVIVATQSVTFVNHFAPDEIVVVERDDAGGTTFGGPLSEERLSEWLEDYSIGELWEKNVIGGRP